MLFIVYFRSNLLDVEKVSNQIICLLTSRNHDVRERKTKNKTKKTAGQLNKQIWEIKLLKLSRCDGLDGKAEDSRLKFPWFNSWSRQEK